MIRRLTVVALLALVPLVVGCGSDESNGAGGSGASDGTGATGGQGTGATGGQTPTDVDGSATCRENETCSFLCTAGNCDHECDGENSVCTSTCEGGSCDQDCEDGATCTMSPALPKVSISLSRITFTVVGLLNVFDYWFSSVSS